MNVSPHRLRGQLLASSTVVFLVYAVWTAHTPGQPRTLRDFIFVMGLFGTPFLVFAYSLWALSGISEVAPVSFRESIRGRLAFRGTILGAVSAALLLLLLPFWSYFTEHEHLATIWGIAGMALAIVATVCGIIGLSKFRRAAVLSIAASVLDVCGRAAGQSVDGLDCAQRKTRHKTSYSYDSRCLDRRKTSLMQMVRIDISIFN